MAKNEITIQGLEETLQALREIEPKLAKKVLRSAIRKGLKPMLAAAKSNAPVDSGTLRNSLRIKAGKRRKNTISLEIVNGTQEFTGESYYGSILEYGSRKMPGGHPYLRPAFDSTHEETARIIAEEIRNGLERNR